MADLDSLSPEAAERVVQALRNKLKEDGDAHADEHEAAKLLRFLKARKLDVDQAAEMYKNSLKWRQEKKVDEITFDLKNGPFSIYTRGFDTVADQNPVTNIDGRNKFYKYGGGSCYHKYDKEFHPIYYERIGLSNSKMIVKHVPFEALFHVKVEANELMGRHIFQECSEKSGRHIETATVIMDCTGLGMQHFLLPALKILGDLSEIDVLYYPERLNKIYWVNAPRIFTIFYDFGKKLFDERILSKVKIVSPEETKATLLEIIDEEHLPSFLGGKCTCSHLEGGCVPSQQLAQLEQVYEHVVNVSAWSDYQKEIEITSPSILKYKFKTIDYDISFGVKFKNGAEEVLVENKLVNSHEDPVEGIIVAKNPGTYVLFFDNSYSMMRSKDLHFNFEVEEAKEQS